MVRAGVRLREVYEERHGPRLDCRPRDGRMCPDLNDCRTREDDRRQNGERARGQLSETHGEALQRFVRPSGRDARPISLIASVMPVPFMREIRGIQPTRCRGCDRMSARIAAPSDAATT